MEEKWFYQDASGQTNGPVSLIEISEKINSGELPENTKIRNEKWIVWENSSNIDLKTGEIIYPKPKKYKKVGGWLLFFCLSLTVFTPLINIFILISTVEIILDFGLNTDYAMFLLINTAITIVIVISLFYAGVKQFQLKKDAVDFTKRVLIFVGVINSLSVALLYISGIDSFYLQTLQTQSIKDILKTWAFIAIWYIYLNKSERVRLTYD